MAYKRITIMDVSEIIRRRSDGQKIAHISKILGYDRKTVRKYIAKVEAHCADRKEHSSQIPHEILSELPGRPAKKQELLKPYIDEIK